ARPGRRDMGFVRRSAGFAARLRENIETGQGIVRSVDLLCDPRFGHGVRRAGAGMFRRQRRNRRIIRARKRQRPAFADFYVHADDAMTEKITSLANEKVKLAADLHQKKYREETGLFLVEGRDPVSDAI